MLGLPGEVYEETFVPASSSSSSPPSKADFYQQDLLIHKWCLKRLNLLLSELSLESEAAPFLVPVAWEELGLDDYPDVIKNPIDLHTISKRLESGCYNDGDHLVDPELVIRDVSRCWQNCKLYFGHDEEVEAVQMATRMSSVSRYLEEKFWAELVAFEESLKQNPTLTSVASAATRVGDAAKDVAERSHRQTAVFANDMVHFAADWWQGSRTESPFWRADDEEKLVVRPKWPARFSRGIAVVRETVRRVPVSLLTSEQAMQSFLKPLVNSIGRTVSSLAMPTGIKIVQDTVADIRGEWILPKDCEPHSHTEQMLMWAHGGGFVLCSPATHRFFLAQIVMHTGIPTFCVDFRKPPLHPFPIPGNDVIGVYKGLRERGCADCIFLGGDSAGGNLVLSVTKGLAEEALGSSANKPLPCPEGLILLSPWVDLSDTSTDSWEKYADIDYIPAKQAEVIAGIYAKGVPLGDARVSPGLCKAWPPSFPRTLLDYGGCEVFRSQIERLAQSMMDHGVELDAAVEDGMVHCYPQLEYLWGSERHGAFDNYFERVASFMSIRDF